VINVLQTQKDPADTDCVVSAANNLEVSEFRIFMDAFEAWYGREASDNQIKPVFVQYLVEDTVPFWVRNYARSKSLDAQLTPQASKDARLANTVLYLVSIALEYAVLAYYLVIH
jgi:hypothetical protein